MSSLIYAKVIECDACGETTEIRMPDNSRQWPGNAPGWLHTTMTVGDGLIPVDICPADSMKPIAAVLGLLDGRSAARRVKAS